MNALPTSVPSLENSWMKIFCPCAVTSSPLTHVSAVTGPLQDVHILRNNHDVMIMRANTTISLLPSKLPQDQGAFGHYPPIQNNPQSSARTIDCHVQHCNLYILA
jgi:hypothetical protein